jgi:hypothetical protein
MKGEHRYQYFDIVRDKSYFVKAIQNLIINIHLCNHDDISQMLDIW